MATTKKVSELQIHVMHEKVYDNFVDNAKINENEIYLVEAEDPNVLSFEGALASDNADYAICFEWSDGNPSKEDRSHRFVQLDSGTNKISFANSTSSVCGVTTTCAAFIENYAVHSDYTANVGVLGIIAIIDNGKCTVGQTCMPDDDGYAVPSNTDYGYRVISRISSDMVNVFVKPNDDVIHRINEAIELVEITESEVNTMWANALAATV